MFSKLQGKVKGYEFEDAVTNKTAFVGPNQSGKTSRLEAVAIATEGKRVFGKNADLEGPDREAPRATLYEDHVPVPVGAYAVILPATGLLALGPSKLRETIAARFGSDGGAGLGQALAPPTVLTERQATTWKSAADAVRGLIQAARTKARDNTPVSVLDVLVDMPGWCRSAKQRFGKEKTGLEARITAEREAIASIGASPELAPELERAIATAEAWERTTQLRARRSTLEQEAEALTRAIGQLQLRIDACREPTALESERAELAKLEEVHEQQHAVMVTIRSAIEHAQAGTCPVCCGSLNTLGAIAAYSTAVVDSEKAMEAISKRLVEVSQAITKIRGEHLSVDNERSRLEREHARLAEAFQLVEVGLNGAPATYDGPSSGELRARLAAIRDAVTRRAATERDAERLESIKLEQDAVKVVESEAGKRLRELLAPAVDAFNAALSRASALTSSRCYFDLEECRFVVVGKDDVHRTVGGDRESNTVSGAEWAQLNLALARAWAAGDGARAVLLVEFERDLAAFDPTNIRAALASVAGAVDQGELAAMFVATSRAHELPEGITVVRTGPDLDTYVSVVNRSDGFDHPMLANLGDVQSPSAASLAPVTRPLLEAVPSPPSKGGRSGRTPRPRAR